MFEIVSSIVKSWMLYWKYCWLDNLNINSKVQSISGLSPSVSFATMVFQEYTGNKTKKAFVCVCHPDKTVKESLYLIQPSINIVLRQLHSKTFFSKHQICNSFTKDSTSFQDNPLIEDAHLQSTLDGKTQLWSWGVSVEGNLMERIQIDYLVEVNQDIFLGHLDSSYESFVMIQPLSQSWRLDLSFESWDSLESFYLSCLVWSVHGCIQGGFLSDSWTINS